ncbi:ExbD/TolR family protein [Croceitalea rosinachiae]|uniref:Biopolymer transporter ExbD n=1 Tax=Croceitalea rosinachiae TaxID=3075596 RepID=A0ABU3A9G9_9FLAO|nr:biopolymer transporter ExbD [Croceitalea sp. F388]MDT0605728.1 biopolymer transporter ExbD [Croceitalea sp. F388]
MRKNKNKLPQVSTASLPDIVFILLFFFMTVTVMKNNALLVENTLPNAQEIEKLDKQDRVIDVVVGPPVKKYKSVLGSESRIQLNGNFAGVNEVGFHVFSELKKMPEQLQKVAIVSLKIDKRTQMGIVNDIKEELKEIGALKINYTTFEGDALSNLP